jgi:hypothetical protein
MICTYAAFPAALPTAAVLAKPARTEPFSRRRPTVRVDFMDDRGLA